MLMNGGRLSIFVPDKIEAPLNLLDSQLPPALGHSAFDGGCSMLSETKRIIGQPLVIALLSVPILFQVY